MTERTALHLASQDQLKEIARQIAAQHGLRPDAIDWVEQFDGWWLVASDARHTVRVVFSLDEIEDFAAEGDGAKSAKRKLRDAFASLTM